MVVKIFAYVNSFRPHNNPVKLSASVIPILQMKNQKDLNRKCGDLNLQNLILECPLLITTLNIFSKSGDDDGAANTECSVTCILISLYSSSLRKSHSSHLQEKTSTGQVWNCPMSDSHLSMVARFKLRHTGSCVWGLSQWFSLTLMKKATW